MATHGKLTVCQAPWRALWTGYLPSIPLFLSSRILILFRVGKCLLKNHSLPQTFFRGGGPCHSADERQRSRLNTLQESLPFPIWFQTLPTTFCSLSHGWSECLECERLKLKHPRWDHEDTWDPGATLWGSWTRSKQSFESHHHYEPATLVLDCSPPDL